MSIRHGVRANLAQHAVLVANVAFIGAMVGVERTVVPLLAREVLGVTSATLVLSFIAGFGITKALANVLSGRLADRFGRRRLLLVGWVAGLPVPFLVMLAPSWGWVVGANLLLAQACGLTLLAWTHAFVGAVVAAAVLGGGAALTYPTLLAAVGDSAVNGRSGSALGTYRFWCDLGFVVGALGGGAVADLAGIPTAVGFAALISLLSGLLVAWRLRETLPTPSPVPVSA